MNCSAAALVCLLLPSLAFVDMDAPQQFALAGSMHLDPLLAAAAPSTYGQTTCRSDAALLRRRSVNKRLRIVHAAVKEAIRAGAALADLGCQSLRGRAQGARFGHANEHADLGDGTSLLHLRQQSPPVADAHGGCQH
ncbi:hypothetical protein [Bradyrhizobium sp. 171]|uniref:hypothetical protein n=1 Tax=Bradyrhizobium sp. 171 TaxID=2782642 RepID=UPI001FFA44CD|nr:hypothetical protein [Bradyrhizobium sp. 171]MCK1538679.1 hypothetical protein [Bradyrhizobium sp. 176]MCK1558621.1 hypothetical protein [Bradyrhizobium sp. 171]